MSTKAASPIDGVVRLMKWTLWLPARIVVGGFRSAKRRLVTPPTESELRADDKARQAGVRRELRGLPTVHNPASVGQQRQPTP